MNEHDSSNPSESKRFRKPSTLRSIVKNTIIVAGVVGSLALSTFIVNKALNEPLPFYTAQKGDTLSQTLAQEIAADSTLNVSLRKYVNYFRLDNDKFFINGVERRYIDTPDGDVQLREGETYLLRDLNNDGYVGT